MPIAIVPIPSQTMPDFSLNRKLDLTISVSGVVQPNEPRTVTAQVGFNGETATGQFVVTSQAIVAPVLTFTPDPRFAFFPGDPVQTGPEEWDIPAQILAR